MERNCSGHSTGWIIICVCLIDKSEVKVTLNSTYLRVSLSPQSSSLVILKNMMHAAFTCFVNSFWICIHIKNSNLISSKRNMVYNFHFTMLISWYYWSKNIECEELSSHHIACLRLHINCLLLHEPIWFPHSCWNRLL